MDRLSHANAAVRICRKALGWTTSLALTSLQAWPQACLWVVRSLTGSTLALHAHDESGPKKQEGECAGPKTGLWVFLCMRRKKGSAAAAHRPTAKSELLLAITAKGG